MHPFRCSRCWVVLALAFAVHAQAVEVIVETVGIETQLRIANGPIFRVTEDQVTDLRQIDVPDLLLSMVLWNERGADGAKTPFYALDVGASGIMQARRTSYGISLGGVGRDPLEQGYVPPPGLGAAVDTTVWVVQFMTHPLSRYRDAVRDLGGTLHQYVAHHAYVVEMDAPTRALVAGLPFVRWVGPYHPAYRLEDSLRGGLFAPEETESELRYSILVLGDDPDRQRVVADRIEALGAIVRGNPGSGDLFQATLTRDQLIAVVSWDEVASIDRAGDAHPEMNIARDIGGAIFCTGRCRFQRRGSSWRSDGQQGHQNSRRLPWNLQRWRQGRVRL